MDFYGLAFHPLYTLLAEARILASTWCYSEILPLLELRVDPFPMQASIEETNRVRASLGLKPLAGTSTAPALAPAGTGTTSSAINSSVGPQLPSTGGGPASETRDMSKGHTRGGTSRPKLDEARAAAEVRAISLKRYTKARPVWK